VKRIFVGWAARDDRITNGGPTVPKTAALTAPNTAERRVIDLIDQFLLAAATKREFDLPAILQQSCRQNYTLSIKYFSTIISRIWFVDGSTGV
jgi:hypothetical protein